MNRHWWLRLASRAGMMETARAKKLCLVGSALVNSFFFSGIVFGWAPLQVMLADEGQVYLLILEQVD